MKKHFKISPFKIGLILTVSVYFVVVWNPVLLQVLELQMLDQRFQIRGNRQPGPEVVIAVVDEKSQDILGRWPWSRSVLARLVNQLNDAGAVTIGFDMVFSESGDDPYHDALALIEKIKPGLKNINTDSLFKEIKKVKSPDMEFAEAIGKTGNVALGFFFQDSLEEVRHLSAAQIREGLDRLAPVRYTVIKKETDANLDIAHRFYAVENNLPLLAEASAGFGYFNLIPDIDGVMRSYPVAFRAGDNFYSPLFLQVIANYLQTKDISLTADKFGVTQIKVGDLDIPVDNKGNFLINYYGGPKTFPHIPVVDIILGNVGRETLEGRIVLVGATGKGIFDLRATPFERIYPGVEINATIIDNILQGNYLRKPLGYLTYNYLLVLLIGIVLSFVISRLKALPGLLLVVFFLISNYFLNQWLFNRGTLINLVYPTIQILGVYLSITGYNYFSESKQRQFIHNAFGQYLSPTVIKRLINNPEMLKLGGEQKRMTVFFSDVTSFSTISENLTPTQLVKLLNEYLSTMTDIILKHDGTIDKYEGDAIIAFFGAPVDYPEHALRACLASIEMQKTLEQMREVWGSQGRSQLTARMGINTGVMLVGNMGSATRMDYTVMGDAVNLASRLEGVNKVYGTYMVISHFTYEDVRTAIQVRELDHIRVVGKTEPVKIYEIIGKKGETPEIILKALERFAKGRELYRKQEWELALERLHEIPNLKPNDKPTQVFIQRCEEFIEMEKKSGKKVFPENWDGVYQMTSK